MGEQLKSANSIMWNDAMLQFFDLDIVQEESEGSVVYGRFHDDN